MTNTQTILSRKLRGFTSTLSHQRDSFSRRYTVNCPLASPKNAIFSPHLSLKSIKDRTTFHTCIFFRRFLSGGGRTDDTTTYAIDWKSLVCRNLRLYSGGTYVLTSTCTSRKLFFGLLLLLLRLMRRHGFGKHVLFRGHNVWKNYPQKITFSAKCTNETEWGDFQAQWSRLHKNPVSRKSSENWIVVYTMQSLKVLNFRCIIIIYIFFSPVAKAASLGSKKKWLEI